MTQSTNAINEANQPRKYRVQLGSHTGGSEAAKLPWEQWGFLEMDMSHIGFLQMVQSSGGWTNAVQPPKGTWWLEERGHQGCCLEFRI